MAKSIFPGKALLAPMAGVTDVPFRSIVRSHGCTFAFTEMLAVKPLITRSKKSLRYLVSTDTDRPLGAQLVGRDPAMLADAAAFLENQGIFSVIDINCGCPVKKVVNKGEGSALLKEPKQIEKIIRAVVAAVQIPVTCKIRSGWSSTERDPVTIARIIEGAGAKAITIHARTKDSGYGHAIMFEDIAAVKKSVSIPVIGNGNIFTAHDAQVMFEKTGCDHVMVARGALGNPWLFQEIETGTANECRHVLSAVEKILRDHGTLLLEFYGEKKAVLLLRKVACWYFKGFAHKGEYKNTISRITRYAEFTAAVAAYVAELQKPQ